MEDLILNSGNAESVKNVLKRVFITEAEAKRIKDVFIQEMEAGLNSGLDGSSLQMENTYVTELVNGKPRNVQELIAKNLFIKTYIVFLQDRRTADSCVWIWEEQTSG